MASSSSGRYQSRLFNWLSQSLGQLKKLQPQIRQLKMRATWGVQVVFYWAYGLIQMARSTGPRLGRAGQPPLATGSIPSSSQPIQQILLEVQQSYVSSGLGTADSTLTASRQDISASAPIQGIATLLTTQTLVLVTEQNQLLDILTLDQQKQLQRRIAQEISSDRHWGRIAQATQQHLNLRFQTSLGQILSWMPRRLAQPIITRLKTRSTRPAISPQLQELSLNSGLVANSQSKIGSDFGELSRTADDSTEPFGLSSGRKLVEVSPEAQNLKSKIGRVLGFLDFVSLQLERQARRVVQGLQQKFHQNLTPEQDTSRDNNFKIQALLRAAIAYFFDWKPLRFLRHPSTQSPILGSNKPFSSIAGSHHPSQDLGQSAMIGTESTPSTKPGQEEPWLTLADLFDGSEVSGTSASTTADEWLDIETEAVLMGYIKHPLEQILEWLDRGLAWLEGSIVALWTHLRPYLSALFQLIQQYWRR